MSQYYQHLDQPHFSYDLYSINGITDTVFRGPAADPSQPYAACLGAAETFGRFCPRPYPALMTEKLRFQFLNLGVGAAGPLWFQAPHYLHLINKARFVTIVVLSGRSQGNSLFDNQGSRGLMGIRKSDGRLMRFEEFLDDLMNTETHERVLDIIRETRAGYVRNMISLLQAIHRPKILLWFSVRTPEYREQFNHFWDVLGDFPHLVNRRMIDLIRPHADQYVECVTTKGIPQKLWEADKAVDGTNLENGWVLNRYYPTPEMHEEAAARLALACARYLPAAQGAAKRRAVR